VTEIEREIVSIAEQGCDIADRVIAMQRLFAERGMAAWGAALRLTDTDLARFPQQKTVFDSIRTASLMAPCGNNMWCAALGVMTAFARTIDGACPTPWIPARAPVRPEILREALDSMSGIEELRLQRIPAMIPAQGIVKGHAPWTPAEARALGEWIGHGAPAGQWPQWQAILNAAERERRQQNPPQDWIPIAGRRILAIDWRFIPIVATGPMSRMQSLENASPRMNTGKAMALRADIETDYEMTRFDLPVVMSCHAAPLRDMPRLAADAVEEVKKWLP
jgi:hypothetical protein